VKAIRNKVLASLLPELEGLLRSFAHALPGSTLATINSSPRFHGCILPLVSGMVERTTSAFTLLPDKC